MAKGPDVRPLIGNTIAMLLVGLILTAMAGSPALAAQAYTISGSVTNFATQTPLKDVLVTAKDASSSTAGFILSDASGHYTISLSSTGIYTVLAGKSGYDDASPPDRPVDITDVSPNAIVNLSMMPQMDSLSLAAGWNFISFPQLPSSSASIETVLNDASPSVRIVWGYDNVNKVWLKYSPNLSLRTPNSLDKVEYGKGYWIYTDTPATISLLSWSPPDSSPISLLEGWNLIGYHGPDNLALSTATQGIFGKWSILWNWDNGQWYGKHATTTSLPSPIQPLASFYRGKAYWIRAKEKTDWVQSMYTNTISQMVPYIEKQLADSGVTGGVSIAPGG